MPLAEFRFNITHAFTPECNGAIHDRWFKSRNSTLDVPACDEFLYTAPAKAYLEDVDALVIHRRAATGKGFRI